MVIDRKLGCDYGIWTIHFRNRSVDIYAKENLLAMFSKSRQQILSNYNPKLDFSTNTDNNLKRGVDSNLVCLFKVL